MATVVQKSPILFIKIVVAAIVRVYLSNGLYKYIEQLLIQTGNSVKIKNWIRVAQLIEKAGSKKLIAKTFAIPRNIIDSDLAQLVQKKFFAVYIAE